MMPQPATPDYRPQEGKSRPKVALFKFGYS